MIIVRENYITMPVLTIALIISTFFLWRAVFQEILFKNAVIQANSAFIAGDFIETQRALSDYDILELSVETRYFLSRAYVTTEALTDVQNQHKLMGTTHITNLVIFDYWIFLGRLQFDEAIDIAQRVGNDELLLFVYVKYEVVIKSDTTISGEEKTTLLNDLAGKISALEKDREEEIAELDAAEENAR